MLFDNEQDVSETVSEETNNDETVEQEVAQEEVLDEKDLKIKELEKKLKSLEDDIYRIKLGAADVMNKNKQLEVEKKYASSGLVRNLLVPISYFEGALKFKSEDDQFNNFLKGFEMVYNLLLEQLYGSGLKDIEVKIHDEFDPKVHEVIEIVESEEDDNKVVEVVQKGYYFKERVIKPAKVKVSKHKENQEETEVN